MVVGSDQGRAATEEGYGFTHLRAMEKSVNGVPIFDANHLQQNIKVVYYSRTFLSIIGGVVAGVLGLTGTSGFVFYLLIMAIVSLALLVKAGFCVDSYFDSFTRIALDGVMGSLLSFVLFWTFSYDIVHIF